MSAGVDAGLAGRGSHLNNLPVQLSTFVGRAGDIERSRRLLEGTRLLTLTGAGGVGKTRLALQLASQLAAEGAYPGGVWLVELAAVVDGADVPQAVASALGLREEPGRSLSDTLVDALSVRAVLLVLDNCEHLIEACAELADWLLRACPRLQILASGREALGVPGETTWRVPSLSVPDAEHGYADELAASDAVRLLVERASAVLPSFLLDARNAPAAASICRRLDGIPLAIELAAARVSVLSLEQIADRLSDCFRLLTAGSRTAVRRHQTLRATVDWSYDLLSPSERSLFRRLAVFVGGWTLEAAEATCTGGDLGREDVLESLAQLVTKSLVLAEERGGAERYRLLEPIRQYAASKLQETSEERDLRVRHARWFMQVAEEAEWALWGLQQRMWLERLDLEHDNLRAALEWSRTERDADVMVRVAAALVRFWDIRGHVTDGRRWLDLALDLEPAQPSVARARALMGAAYLAVLQGDQQAASIRLDEGLALAQTLEHDESVGAAHLVRGMLARQRGDYQQAAEAFETSLALSRRAGHKPGVYTSLYLLASAARFVGDDDRAAALHAESLELKRENGDAWSIAASLFSMGTLAGRRGRDDEAARLVRESLALRRELRDREGIAACLEALARVPAVPTRAAWAVSVLSAAHALREEIGLARHSTRDSLTQDLLKLLGEQAYSEAWTHGRALPLDELLDQVLSGETVAPSGGNGLTRRETEVAALLARGLTNKQIAEALVIAEGTAEKHVANIMGKLDLSSRAQVAVWAANHGLLTAH